MAKTFKTMSEMAERKAFIAGSEQDSPSFKLEQSFSDLDRMGLDDLLDRLEQVDNQATLIKWRIWWAIRQKFSSDKLFGQYIIELRNSTHANCVGSQQEVNRMLNAGRFCEAHRITDLNRVGILQSAIYELSRPANDDISTKIFKEVKHKGYPLAEIQRRIAQARAIDQKPEPMNYGQLQEPEIEPREPYTVEVVKGIAQVGELLEHEEPEPEEELSPEMAEAAQRHEAVAILRENIEEELKLPLGDRPDSGKFDFTKMTSHVGSDTDVVLDIKEFIQSSVIKRQSISKIKIYKAISEWLSDEIKREQESVYPKR